MSLPTVAEQMIAVLTQAGVKRIYGVVGDSLNPLVDSGGRDPVLGKHQLGPRP